MQDSLINRPFSFSKFQQPFVIGNDEINDWLTLCLVFELEEEGQKREEEDELPHGILYMTTCIHRNGKQINFSSSLQIQGIQMTHGDTLCIKHFQWLKCYGFPLKGKDEIQIAKINWQGGSWHLKLASFYYEASATTIDLFNMVHNEDGESHVFPKNRRRERMRERRSEDFLKTMMSELCAHVETLDEKGFWGI